MEHTGENKQGSDVNGDRKEMLSFFCNSWYLHMSNNHQDAIFKYIKNNHITQKGESSTF